MMKLKGVHAAIITIIMGSVFTFTTLCLAKLGINSADDAIVSSQALDKLEAKVNYLIFQGKDFIEKEKYSDAKKVAEYILNKLEGTSQEAKDLLGQAEARIQNISATGNNLVDANH